LSSIEGNIFKYDPVNEVWLDHSGNTQFSDSRRAVWLTLKDDGFGDADGIELSIFEQIAEAKIRGLFYIYLKSNPIFIYSQFGTMFACIGRIIESNPLLCLDAPAKDECAHEAF
jgi:hypothetical protein